MKINSLYCLDNKSDLVNKTTRVQPYMPKLCTLLNYIGLMLHWHLQSRASPHDQGQGESEHGSAGSPSNLNNERLSLSHHHGFLSSLGSWSGGNGSHSGECSSSNSNLLHYDNQPTLNTGTLNHRRVCRRSLSIEAQHRWDLAFSRSITFTLPGPWNQPSINIRIILNSPKSNSYLNHVVGVGACTHHHGASAGTGGSSHWCANGSSLSC